MSDDLVCPDCGTPVDVDEQFDWTDDGDRLPCQGIQFECPDCGEHLVVAIMHYPDHRFVSIEMRDLDEDCHCESTATWRLERSDGAVTTHCNRHVPSMYVSVFDATRTAFS